MLTVLKFTPLDPKNHAFTFLLHPHLKRQNVIDDDLLQLPFVFADEVRIQLRGDHPTICSSRAILGVYVNHQLLGSTPCILRDGDILAFPQRRHKLTTAARFLVEMEVLVLSCGVDKELLALQGFAEELQDEKARKTSQSTLEKKRKTSPSTSETARKTSTSTSSALSTVSHSIGSGTGPPRIFSYAALVASRVPPAPHPSTSPPAASVTSSAVASRTLLGHRSSRSLDSTSSDPRPASPTPTSISASVLEAASSHVPPSTSSAAACAPITSSADPSSTSVLTSGLDHSCLVSAATSRSLTSTDAGVAQGTSAHSPTASDSASASAQVTAPRPSESSSSTERSSSVHCEDGPVRVMLRSAERALHRVGHALLQARLATSSMTTAAVAVERMRAAWREARGAVDSVAVSLVFSADNPSPYPCASNCRLGDRAHCANHGVAPESDVSDGTRDFTSSHRSPVLALADGPSFGRPNVSSFPSWPFPLTSPPHLQHFRAFQSVPVHHHPAAETFMPCASWPWTWPPYLPHLPPYSHNTHHPPMLFRSLHPYSPALVPIPFH